jgi:hypothetical protein
MAEPVAERDGHHNVVIFLGMFPADDDRSEDFFGQFFAVDVIRLFPEARTSDSVFMHKINSRLPPMGVSNKFFVASCFWVIQHFDSFSGITLK